MLTLQFRLPFHSFAWRKINLKHNRCYLKFLPPFFTFQKIIFVYKIKLKIKKNYNNLFSHFLIIKIKDMPIKYIKIFIFYIIIN